MNESLIAAKTLPSVAYSIASDHNNIVITILYNVGINVKWTNSVILLQLYNIITHTKYVQCVELAGTTDGRHNYNCVGILKFIKN